MPATPIFDSLPRGVFELAQRTDGGLAFYPTDPYIPGNPVYPANPASLVIDTVFDVSAGAVPLAVDFLV